MDPDEYVERVLGLVEQIPPGRVTTYGLIAEAVGRGGPRQVGAVMARHGAAVPWWRVVRADGSLPDFKSHRAHPHYLAEATPRRPGGRVDLAAAVWDPLAAEPTDPTGHAGR